MKRLYIWLICHNACPCAIAQRLHLPGAAWLAYYCGRLDKWTWPDEWKATR